MTIWPSLSSYRKIVGQTEFWLCNQLRRKKTEDCKGNRFQCLLSLLPSSPVFLTCHINTLVLSFSLAVSKLNTLSKNNNIIFTWIPSHIGIQGNEKADKAAKKALQIDMCKAKIPYTDLKPTIKKFISDKWQKSWDN